MTTPRWTLPRVHLNAPTWLGYTNPGVLIAWAISKFYPRASAQAITKIIRNGAHSDAAKHIQRLIIPALTAFTVTFGFLYSGLIVALLNPNVPTFWMWYVIIAPIAVGISIFLRSTWFAQNALARSLIEVSHALESWDEDISDSYLQSYEYRFLFEADKKRGPKRIQRACWRIDRCITTLAREQGRKASGEEWRNASKTLLWVSHNLPDPKRRATAWECIAQLVNFVHTPSNVPPGLFVIAARHLETRPSRRNRFRWVASVLTTPIVTGVVVAVATALFKGLISGDAPSVP